MQLRDGARSNKVPTSEKEKPKSILPAKLSPEPLADLKSILDFDPLEIARQLTLLEFELFANVPAYECLDQIWKSKRKKEALQYRQLRKHEMENHSGAHISCLISHTNQFGYWVATVILETEQLKARLQAIKFFIQLALVNEMTSIARS
jgi:son of sevenless-like protein